MKGTINYILLFFLLLNSCKKDDIYKPVYAGIYDSGMFYQEFNPAIKISFNNIDSLNNFKQGADSLDIDQDGNIDLITDSRVLLDINESGYVHKDNYPYLRLIFKNGLEVATRNEIYPLGLGQVDSIEWVEPLPYSILIDNKMRWSEINTYHWMWVVPPVSIESSYGPWYNLTETENYIGIRFNTGTGTIFGWIKVNQISREEIELISYALRK